MASQRFLHSTASPASVTSSSSSSARSRPRSGQWRTLAKWAMSRSSSEASLSSIMLKESDHKDDLRNESLARQQHSLTRSPRSPLRGDAKSSLQHENVKRKQTMSGAGLPPEMSPRKISRPKPEKVASSKAPPYSTSVASPVVAAPRKSFWSTYREEAASDSLAQNGVQRGRKSAPEEKSADGFSRARQGQANESSPLSTRSKQGAAYGSSREKATSEHKRTLASTSSPRRTLKEKSAVKFTTVRQGRESSTLQTPSKRKQVAPKKVARKPVGYKVLQEIAHYQSSAVTLIPCLPFARVVREILFRITGDDFKMQKLALKALHEASEVVIVALLEGTNVLAHHAHRVTIMSRDLAALLTLIKSYGNLQGCLS
ncbi:histone H3.v1-like [Dermacentor silvarum]|uniref:histone H3.v1-like n=1 Tax=Dermacentor silvarum TaxID=543639 RepID=UPI001899B6A1|nr:histone H3.v1-like [Dermacentor silvarum]